MEGTENLRLRLTPDALRTLALAAKAEGLSFVRDSALTRASETVPDRQHFALSAEKWEAFIAALDAPARELPRLRQLLQEPGVFPQNTQN